MGVFKNIIEPLGMLLIVFSQSKPCVGNSLRSNCVGIYNVHPYQQKAKQSSIKVAGKTCFHFRYSRKAHESQQERITPDIREPLLRRTSVTLEPKYHDIQHWLRYPDTERFHMTLSSRVLRRLPFLIEILYWLLTYWPYQLLRAFTALQINSNKDHKHEVEKLAKNNAMRILRIERWLGMDFEHSLQQFVLKRCQAWVMTLLCDVYLAHITVGIAFIGYAYT